MDRLTSLFMSRGAPTFALEPGEAAERLREPGANVTLDRFAGLGHGVNARVARRRVELSVTGRDPTAG